MTSPRRPVPLLGVNIDHVATLRNARGGRFPDPVAAAMQVVDAGADIITFHLREDRRHIKDEDVFRLKAMIKVPLNFEAAVTEEMLNIMESVRPDHVCLVPERRQEVTTEGGLNVHAEASRVKDACQRLAAMGARVSLFIDADPLQIEAAAASGAPCVELHTGALALAWFAGDKTGIEQQWHRLKQGLTLARRLGLRTHAGHGLALWEMDAVKDSPSSTALVASLPEVDELHIGHALIGHAISVGLTRAIADFKVEIHGAATTP